MMTQESPKHEQAETHTLNLGRMVSDRRYRFALLLCSLFGGACNSRFPDKSRHVHTPVAKVEASVKVKCGDITKVQEGEPTALKGLTIFRDAKNRLHITDYSSAGSLMFDETDEFSPLGSGFLCSYNGTTFLITNQHVLKYCAENTLKGALIDKRHDIAAIPYDQLTANNPNVALTDPSELSVIPFPQKQNTSTGHTALFGGRSGTDYGLYEARGNIHEANSASDASFYVPMQPPERNADKDVYANSDDIGRGFSGSPVVDSMTGELYGVHTGTTYGSLWWYRATSIRTLEQLLQQYDQ